MSILFNLLTSSLIFLLGFYIKKNRNPLISVRKNFFYLTLSVGLWTFLIGFRQSFPYVLRPYASLILLSIIFAPFFLSRLVNKLVDESYNPSFIRIIVETCLIAYLSISALIFNLIKITDLGTYTYKPLFAYHVLILYSILWILESIFKLAKCLINSDGMVRVRLSLMLFGVAVVLLISITLVWILPFFGLYLGSYVSIGTLTWILSWAVAILHYDAFQTRNKVLSGEKVPFMDRITLNPILKLYSILDPEEFEMRRLDSNSILAIEVINTAFEWIFRANIPFQATARKIAIKYDKYLK
ncbi:LIC10906 family membrane protein [Leptospira weilii]|uniref:LIC10906 family membrane protein n=1 Tax=Leptospira weilii TaxID=28184 RepID=UPI000773E545|nr:hypothetical protein [Leptospira weilii]